MKATALDHLATARAALEDVRAWSVECDRGNVLHTEDGDIVDWLASWDETSMTVAAEKAVEDLVDDGVVIDEAGHMVRVVPLVPATPAIAALCDEVERLRTTVDAVKFDALIAGYKARIAALCDEVERLRAENARQSEHLRAGGDAVRSANASTMEVGRRLDAAGERIATLEAALRAILDAPQGPAEHDAMTAARRLLDGDGCDATTTARMRRAVLHGIAPKCKCGRLATLNGRCMACASRESE